MSERGELPSMVSKSKLVVAVAKDRNYNAIGYRVYDKDTGEIEDIPLSDMWAVSALVENFSPSDSNNNRYVCNEADEYVMYASLTAKWRLSYNKGSKILFYQPEDEKFYLVNYAGILENADLNMILNHDNSTDNELKILNSGCVPNTKPWADIEAAAGLAEITEDNTDNSGGVINNSKIIYRIEKEEDKIELHQDNSEILSGYGNNADSYGYDMEMTEKTEKINKAIEYDISIALRKADKSTVSSLNSRQYCDFTKCRVFMTELDTKWIKSKLKKSLSEVSRFNLADGNTVVKYESSESFTTTSNIIRGSKYNNIYVLFDKKTDKIICAHTSYKEIEDIMEELLDITDIYSKDTFKELNVLARNIHIENPRFDIAFVGACISRVTGELKFIAHIKELGREYDLVLCPIDDYDAYMSWAEYVEKSDNPIGFLEIKKLITSKIKNIDYEIKNLYSLINGDTV